MYTFPSLLFPRSIVIIIGMCRKEGGGGRAGVIASPALLSVELKLGLVMRPLRDHVVLKVYIHVHSNFLGAMRQ